MKLKCILWLMAAATLILLLYIGYNRYRYARSLQAPLPNHWASLSRNFDAVSQDVQRRFPNVTHTEHYNWTEGYIMGFSVRPGTTRMQAKQIVDYAYPRWVLIREWAGMGQHASECNVSVFSEDGTVLSPE